MSDKELWEIAWERLSNPYAGLFKAGFRDGYTGARENPAYKDNDRYIEGYWAGEDASDEDDATAVDTYQAHFSVRVQTQEFGWNGPAYNYAVEMSHEYMPGSRSYFLHVDEAVRRMLDEQMPDGYEDYDWHSGDIPLYHTTYQIETRVEGRAGPETLWINVPPKIQKKGSQAIDAHVRQEVVRRVGTKFYGLSYIGRNPLLEENR